MLFPDGFEDSDYDELGNGQKRPRSKKWFFILIWTEALDAQGAALDFQAGLRDTPFASNSFEIMDADSNVETPIDLPPLATSRWRQMLLRFARRTPR